MTDKPNYYGYPTLNPQAPLRFPQTVLVPLRNIIGAIFGAIFNRTPKSAPTSSDNPGERS